MKNSYIRSRQIRLLQVPIVGARPLLSVGKEQLHRENWNTLVDKRLSNELRVLVVAIQKLPIGVASMPECQRSPRAVQHLDTVLRRGNVGRRRPGIFSVLHGIVDSRHVCILALKCIGQDLARILRSLAVL